jgi:hypothetical protein
LVTDNDIKEKAMRPLGLLLVILGGCTAQETDTFEHRSELYIQARGLALYEDGESGSAGMWETTCEFDTERGETTTDIDAPGEKDEILDASSTSLDQPAILIATPAGTYLGFPEQVDEPHELRVTDVIDANFVDQGIVTLANPGSCQVHWGDSDTVTTIAIPEDYCEAPGVGIDSDFSSGLVVISTDDDGAIVTPEQVITIEGLGDLVAWDHYTQTIYAAHSGTSQVRGHGADGGLLWETEVEGAVVSLDDMGPRQAAMVMIGEDDGSGIMAILDGYTGELVSSTPTPSSAKIQVSDNGKVLAAILPDIVHFYDIHSQ